jgi:hypothetical protein
MRGHGLVRLTIVGLLLLGTAVLPGVAAAQGQYGSGPMGPGMMGGYGGHMGGGMMGGWSGYGSPGSNAPAAPQPQQSQLTAEQAKGLAQQYADQYLRGFKVDKVLPFNVPRGTAYSVELRGPKDEVRVLHVNPRGNVVPFSGSTGQPG